MQAQKMEAIGALAGGITHDFNNILTAIIGYSELLMEKLSKESEEHAHACQIFQAGGRARDLTRQILTFSRQGEQRQEEVQVYLIVKEALKLLKASLPATISLRQNVESSSGAVLADPTQIHQIIMNLCTNAYHAMGEDGGELRVELSSIEVDAGFAQDHPPLRPGAHLRLTVSDTGSGMDEATQARIFEPFFTTRKQGSGTGLGLAIVHGIVTGLGGCISVQSRPGSGSTFEVYLPKHEAAALPAAADEAEAAPRGAGQHILVVDDDQALLKMTSLILSKLNYRVTACGSAVEALAAFAAAPADFDLVFTDQIMPRMTGAQFAVKVMELRPEIPVIIATGFSEKLTPEAARQLGLRHFLQKPFTRQQLARVIYAELNRDSRHQL
ncbi:MAG: Wide host range VirA protein [Deltaproteobacteria bacterium ADurb.Bin510]|nr:MAG: Wide host range VirA protein [Deltaproteobacteria bacterium ADurb.Bin510]